MPFDWMSPKRNDAFVKTLAGRFDSTLRVEVEQRARLMMNLGVARDVVVKRLQDRVKWDFEMSKVPPLFKEVGAIVDKVFRREHR
jgi:hypothetical protein